MNTHGTTNLGIDATKFKETPVTEEVKAFEDKHVDKILAMRSCGAPKWNYASLQAADDVLMDARDTLSSAAFALLITGSASRWRFSAVWKTLRSHIIEIIDILWTQKIRPYLDQINLNEFIASIESAMEKTKVSEQDLRFLVQCVQLGKPSVQLPLEVYLSDGGYKGGV